MALAGAALAHAASSLLVLRAAHFAPWAAPAPRRRLLSGPPSAGEPPPPARSPASKLADPPGLGAPEAALPWRAAEAEILGDIGPALQLIKDILHTDRYGDGECLSPEDETVVVEKLLAYHPRAQDKIGCGLDAIMIYSPRSLRREAMHTLARSRTVSLRERSWLIGTLSSGSQDAFLLFGQTVFGLISHTRSAYVHTSEKSILPMLRNLYENISSEHEVD